MKIKQQTGVILNHIAAADIASGDVVIIGARAGVAITDIATGETGAILTEGVVTLPKAAGAIAQGALVYWTGTAVTTTATDNDALGFAAEAVESGATVVAVKLNA